MAHTSFGWLFGEFRAVDMATVAEPFRTAADTLQSLVFASASDVLGAVLLEHLFYEGTKSEVGFSLGMSVAWLLPGADPEERSRIITTLKTAPNDLRSKRVHGAEIKSGEVQAGTTDPVAFADRLLRPAIIVRLVAAGDDAARRSLFSAARVSFRKRSVLNECSARRGTGVRSGVA